jgi:hypothetical protein
MADRLQRGCWPSRIYNPSYDGIEDADPQTPY